MEVNRDTIRADILEAALKRVPFDGWTIQMMHAAARDAGHPALEAERVFPGGVAEMVALFCATADQAMVAAVEEAGIDTLKIRERIALCVRTRLEQQQAHKEAIRRALALTLLPPYIATGTGTLAATVDAMWRAAGDQSTDYNWYSKRILLSGVYSKTLLFWLNDDSEDHLASWEFLDRRIANVMQIQKWKSNARKTLEGLVPSFHK